ncbi:MAG: tetratricopeptide repeat protein, partial [Chloroflexi bacterium]|nr:tetratricopeptide repeat protein [Chloroflexota bacterium]
MNLRWKRIIDRPHILYISLALVASLALLGILIIVSYRHGNVTSKPVVQSVPTFTPTPGGVSAASALTASGANASLVTTTTPRAPTPTSLPTATPKPTERLAEALRLHRYGDYANARAQFAAVLAEPASDPQTRLQAHYGLARAYMAEDSYTETITALDRLDKELAATGASKDAFQSKEQFLRAEALAGLGQPGEAIAAYRRFLDVYPWMAEIVQQRIASTYAAEGDNASAAVAYRRAADVTTDTTARVGLLEKLAATYNSLGRYSEAVGAYDEILAVAKNADYRAAIEYQAGQALVTAGDTAGALERWLAATTIAPASKSAYSALVEIVNRDASFDLYQRGYIDLQAGTWAPAISAFQAYIDSATPTDSRYAEALHGLGQAQLYAENYSAARETLERVLNGYPQCTCYGQAWLDKAAAQTGLGDSTGARRTYRTFAREHKDDPLAPEALWQSGLQAMGEANQVEAGLDLLALADTFPHSERAPLALYEVGMGAYQNKLYSQTVSAYSRLQKDYPTYNWLAVGFWLGRGYQAEGKMEQARSQWQALVEKAPDVYYGILAAQSLRQTPLTAGNILSEIAKVAGPPSTLPNDDGSQTFAEQWLSSWITESTGVVSATVDLSATVPPTTGGQFVDARDLANLPAVLVADPDLRMGRLLLEMDQRGDAMSMFERVFQRYKTDARLLYPLSLEFERIGAYSYSIIATQKLIEVSG